MTDRIYSCKSSPDGRHSVPPKGHICIHCHRSMTYLLDQGWNAPTEPMRVVPICGHCGDAGHRALQCPQVSNWNVIEGDH